MALRLYRFQFSTNVERVTLALGHKGLEAESVWVDVWPYATDTPSRNLYNGELSIPSNAGSIGRVTIARHGSTPAASAPRNVPKGQKMPGAINIGFADGHVELVRLEKLWDVYWHRDYQPPSPRPP